MLLMNKLLIHKLNQKGQSITWLGLEKEYIIWVLIKLKLDISCRLKTDNFIERNNDDRQKIMRNTIVNVTHEQVTITKT